MQETKRDTLLCSGPPLFPNGNHGNVYFSNTSMLFLMFLDRELCNSWAEKWALHREILCYNYKQLCNSWAEKCALHREILCYNYKQILWSASSLVKAS